MVNGVAFRVAVLFLNCSEEKAFEQSDYQLLLLRVEDFVVLEQLWVNENCLVDSSLEVLHRHEVFGDALQEIVAKEFVAYAIRLKVGVVTPLVDIADGLAEHVTAFG